MRLDEYARCDGLELARLVRAGEVSARELAALANEAIDALNPQVNAVIGRVPSVEDELANAPADGPFAGVPFLVKDLVLHARGLRCDMGSSLIDGAFVAPADSELMARFRRAGFTLLGRTNTPEFGFCCTTEPVLHGPTRNPWDLTRSPGGSSGGSAAAVAAGMVPIAHANDGGGSTRIPASMCGLVGLKGSRGRVPVGPDYGEPLHGLGVELAVTRTVRDTAAVLDAVHGPGIGDRYVIAPPARAYLEEIATPPGRLRIAVNWAVDSHSDAAHPACIRTLQAVAARCSELGHHVEEAAPQYDADAFHRANIIFWCSFLTAGVVATAEALGRKPGPENLEASVWNSYQFGLSLRALDLEWAFATANAVTRGVAPFFEQYDVLLTPVTNAPPAKLGELNANDASLDAQAWYDHLFRRLPYTALYNMTGQPAISLPLGFEDGLPIGVQAVARFGDEATLLKLAAQLEHAMPWAGRVPPIHASRAAASR